MSMIAIRVTNKEKELMEQFAKFEGKTLSAYLKELFYEKLEDAEDIQVIKEYEKKRKDNELVTYSHEDVWGELNVE